MGHLGASERGQGYAMPGTGASLDVTQEMPVEMWRP